MKYRKAYPLYLWHTTAFIGSTLLFWGAYLFKVTPTLAYVNIKGSTFGVDLTNAFSMYLVVLLLAVLFTIPTWLALWLAVYLFAKTSLNETTIRVWLAFIGILLLYLTVFSLGGKDMLLSGAVYCYTLPLVFGAYYFKLTKQDLHKHEI